MIQQMVQVAIAKIEIALGLDVNTGQYRNRPNIEWAQSVLADLENELTTDDDTQLEMLGIPAIVVSHLRSGGVTTAKQLQSMTDAELLAVDQIRAGRLEKIDNCLAAAGLSRRKCGG